MEFQGKVIRDTEGLPGKLFVGDLPYLYPDIAGKATRIDLADYRNHETEAISDYFKGINISNAEDNAVWMLLNDPHAFNFNELRLHLAVVTCQPYIRMGEKDNITDLQEDGITVEDSGYSLSQYLEEMLEIARQELRIEISLGEIAMYAVDPDLLNEEQKYCLDSGLDYELVIDKLEDIVEKQITAAYKKRLDECRSDGANYGLNTAIALAKEKPFKGTRDVARALVGRGLLTDVEYAEFEKYELLNQANEKNGDML